MRKPTGSVALPLLIVLIVLAAAGVAGYAWYRNTQPTPSNKNIQPTEQGSEDVSFIEKVTIPTAQASTFATYEPVNVSVAPEVPTFTVADDFSNVHNKDQLQSLLSEPAAKEKMLQNGFIVVQGYGEEFYPLYESHRYSYTPSFITVDSFLHNYHLLFDYLLKKAEEGYLIGKLKALNTAMLSASETQYDTLKGGPWENAAKRNVAFFSVGSKLLDSSVLVPAYVQNEVNQELSSIEEHSGIKEAVVINMGITGDTYIDTPQGRLPLDKLKEDYSQYVPRGHYDRTEALKAYFNTMMWYGRMTFRLKNEDEVRSAVLTTLLLADDERQGLWEAIYEPTNFFVGKSDDISYHEFAKIIDDAYSQTVELSSLPANGGGFIAFKKAAEELEPPQINSIPIFQSSIQPDREKEIKGFRFMGQRFTIDASIMQRLVCRDVGNTHGTMDCGGTIPDSRMTPKGLDITAAMGSQEAYDILEAMGETAYQRYPENMQLLQDYTKGLDISIWTQNLYWGWLYALKPLVEPATQGYPSFMQNQSWIRKDLNSYLGSWTELKHDTILYTKQVYAELGGGGDIPQYDDRGYVEPRPDVFARLAALTKMTREGLDLRDLISDSMKDSLQTMETLSLSLKTIAEKELNNVSRTAEEYELIRSYGGQLEHFWLEVNKDDLEASGMSQRDYLDENPAAIVADVATDPNGTVLEEATGKIDTIWVLVEVEGVVKVAQGGVYTYYEFPWPLSDRLTDKKWRELLDSENRPDRPDWTDSFLNVF